MPSPASWFRSRSRSPYSTHATKPTTATVALELTSATEAVGLDAATEAAEVRFGIRAHASARARSKRAVQRLTSAVARVTRAQQSHARLVEARERVLESPRFTARYIEVLKHESRSAKLGHLTSWIHPIAIALIAIMMFLNDPIFVYTVVRTALDVDVAVGTFDISNTGVILALTAAAGLTIVLLFVAGMSGKAFGTVFGRSRQLKQQGAYPELERTAADLGTLRPLLIGFSGLAIFGGIVAMLWNLAHERLLPDDGLAAVSTATATSLSLWIAALPVIVLILETIASVPAFKHAREVARWAHSARRTERIDVWRENRRLMTWRSAQGRARQQAATVENVLADVALRSADEFASGALATSALTVPALLAHYGFADASSKQEQEQEAQPQAQPTFQPLGIVDGIVMSTHIISPPLKLALENLAQISAHSIPKASELAARWRALRSESATASPSDSNTAEEDPGPDLHLVQGASSDSTESAS